MMTTNIEPKCFRDRLFDKNGRSSFFCFQEATSSWVVILRKGISVCNLLMFLFLGLQQVSFELRHCGFIFFYFIFYCLLFLVLLGCCITSFLHLFWLFSCISSSGYSLNSLYLVKSSCLMCSCIFLNRMSTFFTVLLMVFLTLSVMA